MKKYLLGAVALLALGGQAVAADMAVKARPAPPPPPPPSWTGLYIGGHLGGGWSDFDWTSAGTASGNGHTSSVFVGGGQLGYNYQFMNNWVAGVEGEGSYLGFKGDGPCGALVTCESKPNWLATLTGRLGYSMPTWLGQTLLYAKGGGAWVHDRFNVVHSALGPLASSSDTKSGWVVGVGLEFMAGPNWSAKLEYQYADFGSVTPNFTNLTGITIDQTVQTVKVGLNYNFNWSTPWVPR